MDGDIAGKDPQPSFEPKKENKAITRLQHRKKPQTHMTNMGMEIELSSLPDPPLFGAVSGVAFSLHQAKKDYHRGPSPPRADRFLFIENIISQEITCLFVTPPKEGAEKAAEAQIRSEWIMTRRHGNAIRRAHLDARGQEDINEQMNDLLSPPDQRYDDEQPVAQEPAEPENVTEAA